MCSHTVPVMQLPRIPVAVIGMLVMLLSLWTHASQATPQYFPGTGHYYEVIADFAGLSWSEARAAAEGQVWEGYRGYLACIASAGENQFVFDLSLGSGVWYPNTVWEIGPWLGGFQMPGSEEPDEGWTWISGEPWGYSNWLAGQPDNNNTSDENRLIFWGNAGEPTPTWNDYVDDDPVGPVYGYVVEFDGPGTGACCFPSGVCLVGTETDCSTAGGAYMGDGVPCNPSPCESTPVRNLTWGEVKSLFR